MMAVKVKFKKDSGAISPVYAHPGDAGLDIFANETKMLMPNHRTAIKTGLYFELPTDCVGLVWDKSGLALKKGVHAMAGVLDSGYRGELKVVLVNLSSQDVKVEAGTKIAQLLIQKIETAQLEETRDLSETSRGDGGFGSTGLTYQGVFSKPKISESAFKDKVESKFPKTLTKLKPKGKVRLKKASLNEIKRAIKD